MRLVQWNDRGTLSGYIALVVQWLLESELVIIELLSTMYNCNPTIRQHRLSDDERRSLGDLSN